MSKTIILGAAKESHWLLEMVFVNRNRSNSNRSRVLRAQNDLMFEKVKGSGSFFVLVTDECSPHS